MAVKIKINETLKVVANSFFPYVTITGKEFHGPAIEILNGLSQSIGFDYTIRQVKEQGSYNKKTGNWSGVMGMLIADISQRHTTGKNRLQICTPMQLSVKVEISTTLLISPEVDIAAMPFMINEQRYQYVWFTPHMMAQDITILAAQIKGEEAHEVSFIAPMFPNVWLGVFLTLILAVFIFYIIRVAEMNLFKNQTPGPFLLTKHMVHFVGVMVGEGITEVACVFDSEKILVGFFWTFAIIVSYWYQGFLSSNMVLNDDDGRINTMSDLAEKDDVRPVLIKGTSVASILENSPEEDFQGVWSNIEKLGKDESIVSGKEIYSPAMFTRVKDQEVAIIAGRMSSLFKLAQQCKNLNGSDFYFAEESFFPHFIALAGTKKLEDFLRRDIRIKMRQMTEAGVIHQMFQWIKYKMPVCLGEEPNASYNPLDLTSLLQSIWILLAGYGLGFVVMVIELIHSFVREVENTHVRMKDYPNTLFIQKPSIRLSASGMEKAVPFVLRVRGTTGHLSKYGKRRPKSYNFWEITSTSSLREYDHNQDNDAYLRQWYPKYYH